jgi:hypothetical protein
MMDAWKKFESWARSSHFIRKVLDWSFGGGNQYLWVHGLAGLIVGLLAVMFNLQSGFAILFVFIGSILWECVELLTDDIGLTYGSNERFYYDGFGDIVAATVCCCAVVAAADIAAARIIGNF